jgi:MFS family permease
MFYWFVFFAVAGGVGFYTVKEKQSRKTDDTANNADRNVDFIRFQRSYLSVYLLAMFADWLKGPYVYALYESYGYNKSDIAMLFLSGFLASGVSGPFVGAIADKYGRQRMCKAFFVIYIASALTKPINNYFILMLGRILSGFATSLLFSVFEAWMIQEHSRKGFSSALLSETFTVATFGNGLVAIAAGLMSDATVGFGGYVGPFLFAVLPLTIGLGIVHTQWYDDSKSSQAFSTTEVEDNGTADASFDWQKHKDVILKATMEGVDVLKNDPRVFYLGLCQSLFEGCMYSFVFLWTPALTFGLEGDAKALPFGLIFAVFMTMIMGGSTLFSIALKKKSVEEFPLYIHGAAMAATVFTCLFIGNQYLTFLTFLVFEGLCGCFFPTFGTLRGTYIPEKQRTTVMNLFRVPLNLYVVVLLQQMRTWEVSSAFMLIALTHGACVGFYKLFQNSVNKDVVKYESVDGVDDEEDFGAVEDGDSRGL